MNKKIALFVMGLLLLPGCYHVPLYRSQSLGRVDDSSSYHDAKNGFILRAKRLTEYDKKDLFGQYSKNLSQHSDGPIEVIYLGFHNLSAQEYLLSFSGIDIPMLSHEEIARLMKTSTAGRIGGAIGSYIGAGIMAFVAWAGIWMMHADNAPQWFPVLPLVGLGGAITGAVYTGKYASAIDKSYKMNDRLQRDLEDKTLSETVVIQSGDKYGNLIFVKASEYKSRFSITLCEQNNRHNTIVFDVDLNAAFINKNLHNDHGVLYE